MKDFILWLWKEKDILPCPILSGIAHYQFVTIHPYIDGNGRTARLLATLIFHLGGYGLKGVYSLEEYYAQDLKSYYNALSIGPSHNYYMGRETADITPWLEYFCTGVEKSFENIIKRIHKETTKETPDQSKTINLLDQKQRAILTLFKKRQIIKTEDIKNHFGIPDRTARWLCLSWVKSGFLKMADKSKKKRAYMLDPSLQQMIIKK
jgi:Fic family protein